MSGSIDRSRMCAYVNIVLLISFLAVVASSVVIWVVLPAGGLHGATFLGIRRGPWTDVHLVSGAVMAAFVVVHLTLHVDYFRALPAIVHR
ncbi:uncharacterized protein Nmlp_3328 [Natronomonas moolapensis 8.8.11]|uniref:Flavinylation-associated cytochrome domain-containing protein n=1 Tax=Natronomonas moolapensis (strain DSM 18674 / CECT 7526 / JCM 14361 / 8.8.11) TaxID=268739 RepID=M1XST7_NATM8|nr:DUF4405 domain-containing protein [Natronomonas moolapensis]CCQ37458.1 uncharacterized protein Nmlp_3328 [Natronomonas moolapensis 8.8.11]